MKKDKISKDVDLGKLWKETLGSLRVVVSPAIFTTWFSKTQLISVKQPSGRCIATIGCASGFVKTTVETRYYGLIQDTLSKCLGTKTDLLFEVSETSSNTEAKAAEGTPLFESDSVVDERKKTALAYSHIREGSTFDNYAVSSSNQMAWAAADAVSKNPGTSYNPLFIWGGVGVGKTHLMMAIGNEVLKNNSSVSMLFCSAEDFTNDIVQGIRNKTTAEFRQRYRKRKVLFVDDIQFIAGKVTVQEEFFHTFNAITSAGGQIVLSSDKPPGDISKLEERLQSRFEAGLIVDISPPDFELRSAITLIKALEKQLTISMEQAQMIAGNIESARKIEGLLIRLVSETKPKNLEVSDELVQRLISKGGGINGPEDTLSSRRATAADVIGAVSKYYSVGKRQLLGKSRARPVSAPRQVLMYILRTDLGMPLEEVGQTVGGRDHTTVMHAVDKVSNLLSSNVQIREDIVGIKKSV